MKRSKFFMIIALFSVITFLAFKNVDPEYPNKESLLMHIVLSTLEHYHYNKAVVDNEISERAFDMYIKRLDNGKRFFLKKDIDLFNKYRSTIDDHVIAKDFSFFDEIQTIRDERINEVINYYKEILAEPISFDVSGEKMETDYEKMEYVKDLKALKERWRKILKYRVMLEYHNKLKRQEKALEEKDSTFSIKPIDTLEKEARTSVLKQFDRWTKDISKEDRDDKISLFINTLSNVMEPHTGYFPPLEKENFNIRISGKLEGIGAQLRQEDGYTKVVKIVPGSASWKQGELEVNDLIIKVAQGSDEAVDIVDMKMDDVLPLIRGEKGTEVNLTVKKEDGSIKVIPIIRDIVVLEESYAKSAVIEYKNNRKVGLIDLRSFYADFQDPKGRRCSRDVKFEVKKLIEENVDGIIIDLRFNGGGSLRDVVDMSGLFIPEGPIVQVKSRDSRPRTLDDRDQSVLYDGPLIIMVNSFSASASEIMAAALQDYGRAIIVGSAPSTFGKGTVQRFFDLDSKVEPRYKDLGALGSMKITIQKFFRINGGSTQLRGVTPDIIIPGIYSYRDIGEKEEEFPMKWDEIDEVYYKKQYIKKYDKIIKRSNKRIAENKIFKNIDKQAKWYKELQENTEVLLNLEEYKLQQTSLDEKSKSFENKNKDLELFEVEMTNEDKFTFESDSIRMKSFNDWYKQVKKDPYIDEAVQIIMDWL